jgi:murein L,D-transpeptidase YcbB/YkuD
MPKSDRRTRSQYAFPIRDAIAVAAVVGFSLTGCQMAGGADRTSSKSAQSSPHTDSAPITAAPQSPQLTREDSTQITAALAAALKGSRPLWLRKDQWTIVARLYQSKGSTSAPSPRWIDAERAASPAAKFAAVLASVDSLGLQPGDYGIASVNEALRAVKSSQSPSARSHADLLLTASFVALVDDLLTGRLDPREVEPSWHIAARAFDVAGRIEKALDAVRAGQPVGDVITRLRPDYGDSYSALLQGLRRYRALARSGGWSPLPAGPTLRVGNVASSVPSLRRRLAAEGYTSSASVSDTLDANLAGMIAKFQQRHGLTVDSSVGPGTRSALNLPVSARVHQIEANLERLRWLPVDAGERFVVVNVPAFILYAFNGTKRELTMRVVVGDELASRRTPIFADTMEYIQFGPYWNVPRSIAIGEILPKARADRGYLARNNYQILRGWGDNAPVVDPRSLSNTALFSARYRVRQKPGPDNALGRVKFMFPNDFAVYLHDTPSKGRFEQADRAVSHGCVRVADPEALAAFVLAGRNDWPRDKIATTLSAGQRVRVNLRDGPPVYLIYLTAYAREGEVFFRDDIYDRDNRVIRALAAKHAGNS